MLLRGFLLVRFLLVPHSQLRVIRAFKSTLEDMEERRSCQSIQSLQSMRSGGSLAARLTPAAKPAHPTATDNHQSTHRQQPLILPLSQCCPSSTCTSTGYFNKMMALSIHHNLAVNCSSLQSSDNSVDILPDNCPLVNETTI